MSAGIAGGSCLMREALRLMPNGGHACQSQLRCSPCFLAMALLIGFRAPLLGHFGRRMRHGPGSCLGLQHAHGRGQSPVV